MPIGEVRRHQQLDLFILGQTTTSRQDFNVVDTGI